MGETEYKWVGNHPQEITGGRVLEPGEAVTLDDAGQEDWHNAELIESGGLIPVELGSKTKAKEA